MTTAHATGNVNFGVIGAGVRGEKHIEVTSLALNAMPLATEAAEAGEAVYL